MWQPDGVHNRVFMVLYHAPRFLLRCITPTIMFMQQLCRIFLRLVAGALSSFGCSSVAVKVPDGHNRDQRSPATEATASYQSPQATVGFLRVHSMKSVFTESQPPLQIPKFIH